MLNAAVAAAFAESNRHNVWVSGLAEFPVVLRPAERLSCGRDITGSSLDEIMSRLIWGNPCFLNFALGMQGTLR